MNATTTADEQTLRALAHVLHAIRCDWDTAGILAALRRDTRPVGQLAAIAVHAALDPDAHTPGVIAYRDARTRVADRPPDPGQPPRFADLCDHGRDRAHCPHCRKETR